MTPMDDIWEHSAAGFSTEQRSQIPGFRDWLRKQSLLFARELADLKNESPAISTEPQAMEELEKSIENEFKTLKDAHQALVLLGKIVAYANRIGKGRIPQPSIPRLVAKPLNPFADGVAVAIKHTRAWLGVERGWIGKCAAKPPIELVVFSAILHGGLLHQSSLIQLARVLLIAPEEAISLVGNRVSIDLKLPWQGVPGAENRRWYPDEQTVALIRKPHAYQSLREDPATLSDEELGKLLLRKLRQRMRSCGATDAWVPATWKQLLDTVATAARTEVPAVLIEYATRRIVSHSLKPDALQRIFGAPEISPSTADHDEAEPTAVDAETAQTFEVPSTEEEPLWLCFLRQVFSEPDPQALRTKLERQVTALSEVSSAGHCITRFALYLLTQRHLDTNRFVRRKPLKPNTVKSFTLTVGKRFGCILGEQNPIDLTTENLETLYTQVLENVVEGKDPKRLRGTVASALREFQEFLSHHCGGPTINTQEILGSGRGLLPVDAKVLTEEQYSKARRILQNPPADVREWMGSDLRHAAEAMLILGFRCGTRRMEAHGLEIGDLTDRSCPWLWIRPTEGRQLKTSNAKRQIPLHETLIPKDELDVLYSWKQMRIGSGTSSGCPCLFAVPEPDANGHAVQRQIPVHKLISLIHSAMRRATDDCTIHYHHLRHSFATWNFLRLMLSDLPEPPEFFPDHSATSAWIKKGKDFRKDLYGTAHPTRKHAMAVASLLGHSGPGVSMEHYIHCMDWLLNACLSESSLLQVPSTHRTILASANRGRARASSLYERRKDLDAHPIPVHLMEVEFPNLIQKANGPDKGGVSKDGTIPADTAWVRKTWDLLFRCGRDEDPLDSLAEELGLDPACAQKILTRAKKLQNIRAVRGKKSHLHRTKDVAIEKQNAVGDRRVPYPEIPRGKGDQEVIRKWEAGFRNPPTELTRSVLGYYVNHVWKTSNTLLFHDPSTPVEANLYLSFLEQLGFDESQLRLIFFEHRKRKRSALRAQWKTALDITWRWKGSYQYRKPPFGDSAASKRWLGIEPSFGTKHQGAGAQGQNGFRFLMVMAAIAFGYTGDEEP